MWKLAFNSDTLVSHLEYTATKISFVWLLCQLTHAGFRARIGRFRILRIRTGSLSNECISPALHSCWWYQVTKCLRKSPHLNSLNHQKFFWTNPVGCWSEITTGFSTIPSLNAQVSSIIAAFVAAKPAGFSNAEAALYASLGCFLLVVFLLTSSQVVGFSWWLFELVEKVELVGEQKNPFLLGKKSLPILPRVNS